jgi:ADP-ribosylglycohydrolase
MAYPHELPPDDLAGIRALRPAGPRILDLPLTEDELHDRLLGALLGRAAGCVLGIPCEGMSREAISEAALRLGLNYPLEDYWPGDPGHGSATDLHYGVTPRAKFLKPNIDYIGADDDIAYTILGLLIAEDYGLDFTAEQLGEAWLRYVPIACTAEDVALTNLRAGLKPPRTALVNNPYSEWIGAAIRSDPWGYMAPGLPEFAAELGHRDASLSHTAEGIYGEMFWAATISAAFVVDDVKTALEIGVTEIPADCGVAQAVRDTIRWCENDRDWDRVVNRILAVYDGMHPVHTINNAALTVAGLIFGRGSFEKTISLTVMAGLDTDCTGATAGSVFGAMAGASALPAKWIGPLGDRIETYLTTPSPWFSAIDMARRFAKLAREARARFAS